MTTTMPMRRLAPEPDSPTADRLTGANEIAAFWYGSDTPRRCKAVYRLAAEGTLPIAKFGGKLVASRRALMRFHERLTDMPTEAAE